MQEIERICEKHGKDEVTLTVYTTESGQFTYSLQCHVSRIIRAIYPHMVEEKFSTPASAKSAAVKILTDWINSSRTARAHFRRFEITASPDQLEFDFG